MIRLASPLLLPIRVPSVRGPVGRVPTRRTNSGRYQPDAAVRQAHLNTRPVRVCGKRRRVAPFPGPRPWKPEVGSATCSGTGSPPGQCPVVGRPVLLREQDGFAQSAGEVIRTQARVLSQ